MKSTHLVLVLSLGCALPLTAAVELSMQENGRIILPGFPVVKDVLIQVYGPEWSFAGNTLLPAGSAGVEVAHGILPMPKGTQGNLDFEVRTSTVGEDSVAGYEFRCTDTNTILGLQLCVALDPVRLAGKRYYLLPKGDTGLFPVPDAEEKVSRTHCTSLGIEQDDGSYLLITGSHLLSLGFEDFRHSWAHDIQLRYYAARDRVIAGRTMRHALSFTHLTAEAMAQRLADCRAPGQSFTSSERLLFFDSAGDASLRSLDSSPIMKLFLAIHGLEWKYIDQKQHAKDFALSILPDGSTLFQGLMVVPGSDNKTLDVSERVAAGPSPNSIQLDYDLTMLETVKLNGYQLSLDFTLSHYLNAAFTLDTPAGPQTLVIPENLGEKFLYRGLFSGLRIQAPVPEDNVTIEVDQPTGLLIQDNRGWGGSSIEVRFTFARQEDGGEVPAGTRIQRSIVLTTPQAGTPFFPVIDHGQPTRTDTDAWKPYTLPWDAAPVDVSFLNHTPAGKFGFVKVAGDRFVLSDTNAPIRFWGTCFSAGANFPSHEQAEKIARRLASFGINIVRTHHADAKWAERHFFPKDADNTRSFDPENLDRFDYLVYCLKREGIYIYLDQLVNRYFKPGDAVDAVDQLGACAKPYSNFDPRLIELQKEYSANLWNHVNPYTTLAYKDDPAIAMMEFANENDLFTQQVTLEPYRTRFEEMYRRWAAGNHIELPDGPIDFTVTTDPMMRFFIQVTDDYYREMGDFLHGIGVRVPMTGSNWSRNAALLACVSKMDYTDSHSYWNHPSKDGSFGTSSMLHSPRVIMDGLGFMRTPRKPFFVSEWDAPWPYEYRAELPLWIASVAAFQGWNGLTVYTYRHSSKVPMEFINGAFETFNDPARFGLMPTAAMLFRRGDAQSGAAQDRLDVAIPMTKAAGAGSPTSYSSPVYAGLSELRSFATLLTEGDAPPAGAVSCGSDSLATDRRISSTGEITRDRTMGTLCIDTPRTQAVQAFFGKQVSSLATSALDVHCDNVYATIAVTSLTDQPITNSPRLLLTTVGRAENSDFTYNLLRNRRTDAGHGPILIDPILGEIAISTTRQNLAVKPVAADGRCLSPIPATWKDGKLSFTISRDQASLYFMIE